MEAAPITLRVEYYAQLRETARKDAESVRACAPTPADLYRQLRRQYEFSLGMEHLRVAVNHEMADWSAPLHDGDTLTFLPPVAGG